MECTLATLLACLSLSNVYVDGGLSWQDRGHTQANGVQLLPETGPRDGIAQRQAPIEWAMTYEAQNPYGRAAIGYEIRFRSVDVRLEVFHRSSLANGDDRGFNGLILSGRWFPFRR